MCAHERAVQPMDICASECASDRVSRSLQPPHKDTHHGLHMMQLRRLLALLPDQTPAIIIEAAAAPHLSLNNAAVHTQTHTHTHGESAPPPYQPLIKARI